MALVQVDLTMGAPAASGSLFALSRSYTIREAGGGELVDLFEDAAGTTPASNPIEAVNGELRFFTEEGQSLERVDGETGLVRPFFTVGPGAYAGGGGEGGTTYDPIPLLITDFNNFPDPGGLYNEEVAGWKPGFGGYNDGWEDDTIELVRVGDEVTLRGFFQWEGPVDMGDWATQDITNPLVVLRPGVIPESWAPLNYDHFVHAFIPARSGGFVDLGISHWVFRVGSASSPGLTAHEQHLAAASGRPDWVGWIDAEGATDPGAFNEIVIYAKWKASAP